MNPKRGYMVNTFQLRDRYVERLEYAATLYVRMCVLEFVCIISILKFCVPRTL